MFTFFFSFFFLELGELMAAASRTRLCIQEWMKSNRCYGCGAQNEKGLNLKSLWNPEDRTAEASFIAKPEHCAGPPHFVNGGILSTLIDCHGICLALADAQDRMGKPLGVDGNQNSVWYVTGSLNVKFARPTLLDFPVELKGKIARVDGKKTEVEVECYSQGKLTAQGSLLALQVTDSWFNEKPSL